MPHDVAGHELPHPQPAPAPAMGATSPPAPFDKAANVESCFLAGALQSGHEIAVLVSLKEQRRWNFKLHFEHLYSYIGITVTF